MVVIVLLTSIRRCNFFAELPELQIRRMLSSDALLSLGGLVEAIQLDIRQAR